MKPKIVTTIHITFILVFIFVGAGLLALRFDQKMQGESKPQIIKIGVITPLTGPLSEYGQAFKNGILMANEERGESSNLEYLFEDSAYDPKKAIAAFHKLTTIDHVSLVMDWGAPTSNAIAPLVNETHVPFIGFAINDTPSFSMHSNLIVRGGFNRADEFAQKQWDYLRSKGIQKVGIIKTELSYLNVMYNALVDTRNAQAGEEVILIDNVQFGDTDFKTTILKIRQSDIDALGVYLASGQIAEFYKQKKQLGLKLQTFGTDFFESTAEIIAAKGSMNGSVYPNMLVSDTFQQNYRERFNSLSQITFAGSGYDIANILAEVVHFHSAEDVLKSLQGIHMYPGALGTYSYKEVGEDRYFAKPTVLKIIDGDKFKVIAESNP